MNTTLHVIWFIVAGSASVANILACFYFLRLKKPFGNYMAFFFACAGIEAVIATFSLIIFWPTEALMVPGFAISRTIGRSIEAVGAWTFLAYLFYWIKPDDDVHQTRAQGGH